MGVCCAGYVSDDTSDSSNNRSSNNSSNDISVSSSNLNGGVLCWICK